MQIQVFQWRHVLSASLLHVQAIIKRLACTLSWVCGLLFLLQ